MIGAGLKRIGRLVGRAVVAGLTVWAVTLIAVIAAAAILSRPAPLPAPADAIICLSAGVSRDDPRLPDPASDRRARACGALQAAGVAPVVIFTGAGVAGHSAAEAMAARAMAEGLPAAAALREGEARSTIQNAVFSRALLPEGPGRVVIVTDAYHLPRSWAIFRLAGYPEVAVHVARGRPEPSEGRWLWRGTLRETLAIWFNAGRGAAYLVGGLAGVDRETRIGWFD